MGRYRSAWGARVALVCLCCGLVGRVSAGQPSNVRLLGGISPAGNTIDVVGRYAYTNTVRGFSILDVSYPVSPVVCGSLLFPDAVEGVRVRDGLAYLANGIGGLKIVDVTSPSSPTLRGSYNTSGFASGVFACESLAYVCEDFQGLQIIDASNPSLPMLRGSYDTPDLAAEVFVSGGLACVADRASLQIVDVTNPSSPTLRGSYLDSAGGRIWNVFVCENVAYATVTSGDYWTGYYATFLSLDIANPAAPRLLGSYATLGVGGGVCVSGDFAYACLGDGLRIFYVRNPSAPTLCGFYPVDFISEGCGCVSVAGGLAYVGGNYDGLLILQFTPPPSQASRWDLYR